MTSWRRDRMVFVDPDDDQLSYWWPALIVPWEEIPIFKETMGADIGQDSLKVGEQLVCYFEDGSYSIVREKDLLSFCPDEEPYLSYIRSPFSKIFLNDRAVILANRYWQLGELPESFKWLTVAYSDAKLSPTTNSRKKKEKEKEKE